MPRIASRPFLTTANLPDQARARQGQGSTYKVPRHTRPPCPRPLSAAGSSLWLARCRHLKAWAASTGRHPFIWRTTIHDDTPSHGAVIGPRDRVAKTGRRFLAEDRIDISGSTLHHAYRCRRSVNEETTCSQFIYSSMSARPKLPPVPGTRQMAPRRPENSPSIRCTSDLRYT